MDNLTNKDKNQTSPALTTALDKVSKEGLNIYALINQTKKKLKWSKDRWFPDEVLLAVCEQYEKDKDKIKEKWPWWVRVLTAKSMAWHAEQNIAEHKKIKTQHGVVKLGNLLK